MRTTIWRISRRLPLLLALLPLLALAPGCRQAEELRYDAAFGPEQAEHVSIARLKSLCRSSSFVLRQSLFIEGRVTANDLYGEFRRCIVVEDASGGIEVALDAGQLYRHYPLGMPLRIFCSELALGDYGGKVVLGAPPTGEYTVDRIAAADFPLRLHPLGGEPQPLHPLDCTFDELTPDRTGRFIRLCGVAFADGEQGLRWCDTDPESGRPVATERHLCDDGGRQLAVYTLGECLYATEPLPGGRGSVCGILDCFDGKLQLRIVNRDFHFTDPATDAAPPRVCPSAGRYSAPSPRR